MSLECKLEHTHDYWVCARQTDDSPMTNHFFKTWAETCEFLKSLACECCTQLPDIDTIQQGKLYEVAYQGSFRLVGCISGAEWRKPNVA